MLDKSEKRRKALDIHRFRFQDGFIRIDLGVDALVTILHPNEFVHSSRKHDESIHIHLVDQMQGKYIPPQIKTGLSFALRPTLTISLHATLQTLRFFLDALPFT